VLTWHPRQFATAAWLDALAHQFDSKVKSDE